MSEEISNQTLEIHGDPPSSAGDGDRSSPEYGNPAVTRSNSFSRLNAGAPEFVPRAAPTHHGAPPAMHHAFHPAPPSPTYYTPAQVAMEYHGSGGGGGFGEHEPGNPEPSAPAPANDGIADEVIQKVTKQVEYYFSDLNLATTEHLMRFITKDPEGFVPISVIAAFKKIKAFIPNNSQLAMALRTSSKLIVSDDGRKVRRLDPFTESDMEELQARIVVAENLPEDHCHQNLTKIFSAVGSVKTIRTCYPQTPNGTSASTNRSKHEVLFGNRLHAFVEFNTVEDAEKAVTELNDENWRNGLRVRLFPKCLAKHGHGRVRKGHEVEQTGEDDVSTSNQPNEKHVEDPIQPNEACHENVGDESFHDKDGAGRRGRGRGRGGRARGRGQHHHNSRGGGHAVGTPPSSHPMHLEQPASVHKQPPGPRMPDGTRGFTMGRGKPLAPSSAV